MTGQTPLARLPSHDLIYDYLFIGLGAANSLILLTLLQKGLLKDKNVAVLEMDSKNSNDKTYCFWAKPNDSIVRDLNSLISHSYTRIKVSGTDVQSIAQTPYHLINSIDLYRHSRAVLEYAGIPIFRQNVVSVSGDNTTYVVCTAVDSFKSHYIFDSRPIQPKLSTAQDIHLHQSFFGLFIRCEKDVFEEDVFQMMNFEVEQAGFTQFIYVLPYSKKEALIELTRFGQEKIDLAYAKTVLTRTIGNQLGKYDISAEEIGCIPMTTMVYPKSTQPGLLRTGVSGNLIKPSTGYAFKNMYEHAQHIAQKIAQGDYHLFNEIALPTKKRFRFYDSLLLIILSRWPEVGKSIFTSLFKQQKIGNIFSFLDEKTTLIQEIKIFASLPFGPFLKALFIYLKRPSQRNYILAFLSVSIYLLIAAINSDYATYFGYAMLAAGLLLLGLPHGAVDHILLKPRNSSLPVFIIKYLLLMGLYFYFWQLFPLWSLLFFISYSAFHFGESEYQEEGQKIVFPGYYVLAFLYGLSILSFIIFSHPDESMEVISQLISTQVSPTSVAAVMAYAIPLSLLSVAYILLHGLFSKKNNTPGLLLILVLGLLVPLYFAFGLYFILHHSHIAWKHLQSGLNLTAQRLYKKAAPYTIGAVLFLALLLILSATQLIRLNDLMGTFFVFLACISLPHFILMHLFYNQQER